MNLASPRSPPQPGASWELAGSMTNRTRGANTWGVHQVCTRSVHAGCATCSFLARVEFPRSLGGGCWQSVSTLFSFGKLDFCKCLEPSYYLMTVKFPVVATRQAISPGLGPNQNQNQGRWLVIRDWKSPSYEIGSRHS